MTDTINLPLTETSKSAVTGIVNSSKAGPQGGGGIDAEDSELAEESFLESMLKAFDGSTSGNESTNTEIDGNGLPLLKDLTDETAEESHLLLANINTPGLNLIESNNRQLLAGTQAAAQMINPVAIEGQAKSDTAANLLSSSIRQLLALDAKTQETNVQLNNSNLSDSVLLRQTEMPQLDVDKLDLLSQKNQLLRQLSGLSASQQANPQQVSSELQTTLLSHSAQSGNEPGLNILATPLTVSSSPVSSISMQALPQAEIGEQFGRPAWSQGMGKQILLMVNQNINSAEIRLNPANLGPIEVRIDISDDQINIALSSRHAAVREAMEMALPKLREMFDSNGLNLADADISQHSFAEQREQNMASDHSGAINDSHEQSDISNLGEEVIQHSQIASAMVDYYI